MNAAHVRIQRPCIDVRFVARSASRVARPPLAPPDATTVVLPPSPLTPADQIVLTMSLDETDAIADYATARNLPAGGLDALLNADTYEHWARATN